MNFCQNEERIPNIDWGILLNSIDSFDLALLKIILLNNFRYLSITSNKKRNLIITSNPKKIKLTLIKEYSVH